MWRQIFRIKYLLGIIICFLVCIPIAVNATNISLRDINIEEIVSSEEQVVSAGDVNSEAQINIEEPIISSGDMNIQSVAVPEESVKDAGNQTTSSGDAEEMVSIGDTEETVNSRDAEEIVSAGDWTVSSGNAMENMENSVIKVVLPTDFTVLMYNEPGNARLNLESQDILIVNKSDFPVKVKVNNIKYEVTQKESRAIVSNELSLLVKEFQKGDYAVTYKEANFVPFYIGLDVGRAETNTEQLLTAAEGWNPIGPVQSSDYSILRLSGKLNDVNLREQDVEIGMVFEFERAQDNE